MRLSRGPLVALSLVVALAWTSARAAAEDEAKPKLSPPSWGAEDILLRDKMLPPGWTIVEDEAAKAAEKALEDAVKGLAAKAEIDDLDTAFEAVTVKTAEGEQVTLLLGDIDVDPTTLTAAVQAEAKAKGWTYRELGTPMRFALVSGPAAAHPKALTAQVRFAVLALSDRALNRAGQASRATSADGARAALESAASVARAAIALDEKAGVPHMVLGMLAAQMAERAGQDKAKWKEAADEFQKAFAEGATLKPDGYRAFQALSQYGLSLLMQKTPEGNAEAKKVLLKALDFEKFDEQGGLKGNVRYNLSCALSLLGEKADAIKQLEAAVKSMKASMPQAEFDEFVNKHIPTDTDLDAIRNEAEFAEAMKRATGGSTSSGV